MSFPVNVGSNSRGRSCYPHTELIFLFLSFVFILPFFHLCLSYCVRDRLAPPVGPEVWRQHFSSSGFLTVAKLMRLGNVCEAEQSVLLPSNVVKDKVGKSSTGLFDLWPLTQIADLIFFSWITHRCSTNVTLFFRCRNQWRHHHHSSCMTWKQRHLQCQIKTIIVLQMKFIASNSPAFAQTVHRVAAKTSNNLYENFT